MTARTRIALLAAAAVAAACGAPGERAVDPRWEMVPAPTTASLRGLSVVDDAVVWVSGARGTVLKTTDGGRTWHDVAPPDCAAHDFRDVEAFGADEALVMIAGQPARVYRTADGGRSWAIVHEDPRPEAFFDAIDFAGDRGVLLGDPIDGAFSVLLSADRGVRWEPVAGPSALPDEAAFAASGTCAQAGGGFPRYGQAAFVTGGSTARFVTIGLGDGGAAVDLPLQTGMQLRGAFGLAMHEAGGWTRGVVVGGDHADAAATAGTAAWSGDGGVTWHPSDGGAGGYRSCAAWLDASRVLAVGTSGSSLSEDCGRTWRTFGTEGFHAIAAGIDVVWACGSDGRIARLHRSAVAAAR